MKKILVLTLLAGALIATVNDAGRYLSTLWSLDDGTSQVARMAARAAAGEKGPQAGGSAAVREANSRGIEVYGYQLANNQVIVWTRALVYDTWVAGPVLAWYAGQPLDTPIEVTSKDDAFVD